MEKQGSAETGIKMSRADRISRRWHPDWRAFRFETSDVLLHVPSSHLLEIDGELADHLLGYSYLPDADAQLADLAAALPKPPPRQPLQTNVQAISLNMAQGCNLRCTYCFAGEGDYGNKSMMSATTAIDAVRFFAKGKDRFHIAFFGGEPLLNYRVIQEVVDWCEGQSCAFGYSMTTNATLLTKEKLAWLRSRNFRLTISYDGKGLQAKQRLNQDKTTNSEQLVERKLETFKEQLGSLRSMLLRSTITRANLDLLENAIVETLNSKNFKLVVSRHATPLRAFSFTEDDIKKLGEIYQRVVDRFVAAGEFAKLLKLDNMRTNVQKIHQGKTRQIACGAGINYLTVSTEGQFYLCHRFNEDESENFGSVETGLNEQKLRAIADFRAAKTPPCNGCWMREWCAGGCMHEHKSATGDTFTIDPMYCKLQGIEIEQAMRVYTHLLTKAPHLLDPLT